MGGVGVVAVRPAGLMGCIPQVQYHHPQSMKRCICPASALVLRSNPCAGCPWINHSSTHIAALGARELGNLYMTRQNPFHAIYPSYSFILFSTNWLTLFSSLVTL